MPRVNRCIELFEHDQPVYYSVPSERSHAGGVRDAQTWADYIVYDVEHHPFDMNVLRAYMAGLIAGGPTRSGHRTPAVIVTLPFDGVSPDAVRANSWIIKQALACGVHGLLLVHAESPEAVKTFVEYARYPFNSIGVGAGLDEGRRGGGGQADAAAVWGIPVREYLDRADPWPLNPHGELLLGLKIENKRALSNCALSLKVSGISFAEWGPGDMGMSLGFPDNHDEPYPPAMEDARSRVLADCMANDIKFLSGVYEHNVAMRIDEGVRICANRDGEAAAKIGRAYTRRTMPV